MKFSTFLLAAIAGASSVAGTAKFHSRAKKVLSWTADSQVPVRSSPGYGGSSSPFLTSKTKKFVVNGKKIPEVDFDIGESYAGTLPITSNSTDENRLYFWFFPSQNPAAKEEIVIWLNGGPGCSSLDGLFQENGPFLWQSGTYRPQANPFSWTNLTNVIYIDQPIGTGLSPAAPGAPAKITNELIVASQFAGFWKNFVETFDIQKYKIYIAGESYAGQYIPYIANHFLETNDTSTYNLKGIQINDPVIGSGDVTEEAPAVKFLNTNNNIFNLNASFVSAINKRADVCGWTSWLDNALTFPPKGPQPTPPNSSAPGCDVWDDIINAAVYVNPCFNIYHITDYCPFLWDIFGFPSLAPPAGDLSNYFNRTDVQKAINAPVGTNYFICSDPTLGLNTVGDSSPISGTNEGPLANVIEKTNNVIIGHGLLDFILLAEGSLAVIQNLTWNGARGFSRRPSDDFFVPYSSILSFVLDEIANQPLPPVPVGLVGGGGIFGTTHTERGLTFVTVTNAGHQIPQYNPGAAYRQLEFLLGRIESLSQRGDFTTQTGNFTGTTPL